MKTLVLFMLIMMISPFMMAQITFERPFGGAENDIGYCVQQTSDSGYIICGTSMSFNPYFLNNFYIVKTNKLGFVDWESTFGQADFGHLLKSIRQTPDGGYIACGQINGPGDGNDFYLVKFTEGGDTSWTKQFNKGGNDLAEWIEITKDQGYIICGMANNEVTHADIYLVKTDASGQMTWDKTIDMGKKEHGLCIRQTKDEGYIISGYQEDLITNKDDIILVKTNGTGDTSWTKTFGSAFDDMGFGVCQTEDEGYVIAGYTFINDFNSQVYLIKTNSNGTQEWAKSYGGNNLDVGYSLYQTDDNGFIICGSECSFGYGYDDVYLIKTNSGGDTLWTRHFGGSEIDVGLSVMQTYDNGYIICGYTASMGAGEDDVYLIKTDANGHIGSTGIQANESDSFIVYPNPAKGKLTIDINNKVNYVEIFNSRGTVVYSKLINGHPDHSVEVNVSGLPGGLYIIRIDNGTSSSCRKVMIYL